MSQSTARRPPRDPAAPKRNMSAYLLYQNAMRDTFKQQNPGMTFGQLSKYTSAMYAEMPPAEKEAWNQRAEADKARYLHELSTYVPPPGYDVKGDAIATHVTHTLPPKPRMNRGTIKTPRDPNAPKRNMSAYLLYQNCMRETFKNINPGMTFGQLAKFTSHMYKSLSAEEKQRWEAHAAQDKARYEAEMASYVPPVSVLCVTEIETNVLNHLSNNTLFYFYLLCFSVSSPFSAWIRCHRKPRRRPSPQQEVPEENQGPRTTQTCTWIIRLLHIR